jgi:hypothetical protein
LNAAFEKYVMTIVGSKQYLGIKERYRRDMVLEFDRSIKRGYMGEKKAKTVHLRDVKDDRGNGIFDEEIKLQPWVTPLRKGPNVEPRHETYFY